MESELQLYANPLRRAFGHPLPPQELERWLMASPAQRASATARLDAVLNWPAANGRDAESLRSALTEAAGMKPKRMKNLVAMWRSTDPADRSLALLGIRADRRRTSRHANKLDRRETAATVVRELVGDQTIDSVEAVALQAMDDPRLADAPVGLNMLRELVRELRLERGDAPAFGGHIIIDQMPLAVCAASGTAYRTVLVLDEATRLALGVAVEAGPPTIATVRDAARDAAERLRAVSFPGVSAADGETRITVAVSDPNALAVLRFFASQPGWSEKKGRRGREAAAVLGRALGRVPVRPGLDHARELAECDETIPRISPGEATALLDLAIRRHNSELLRGETEDAAVASKRAAIASVMEDASLIM